MKKTFEEWIQEYGGHIYRTPQELAKAAWDYQQEGIDNLLFEIHCLQQELARKE